LYTVNLTITDGNGVHDTKSITDAINVTQPTLELTLANVPISLALNPGETTTNTSARFLVNSTTDWEVTAKDTNGISLGYMTNFSGTQYGSPATKLNHPFNVLNSTGSYVAIPSGAQSPLLLKTGHWEDSGTAYPLGMRQDVTMIDTSLSSPNVYRIVVTLTVGSV
jgi:hypothetical protein